MSLSEIIKNLTEENDSLREDNKRIREQKNHSQNNHDENELHAIIQNYQKKAREMMTKIKDLETQLNETKSEIYGSIDKSRYKALARKLKEERNMYRDMLQENTKEHKELKDEMEKMSFIINDLKEQCKWLQEKIDKSKIETTDNGAQIDFEDEFPQKDQQILRSSSIPPKYPYCSPITVEDDEKPKKDYKDASVQYDQEELLNDERCISEFEKYSSCSSLTEEFKFVTPRFTDSALLIEEEQDRQEAIEEIQATFLGHCYRKEAVESLEMDKKMQMKNGGSISWSLASKNFSAKLKRDQVDDDQDVVCTY